MSRRHHGRPHHHAVGGPEGQRRVAGVSPGAPDRFAPKPTGDDATNGTRPPAAIPTSAPAAATDPRATVHPEPARDPVPAPVPSSLTGPPFGSPEAPLVAPPAPTPPPVASRAATPQMPLAPTNGAPGLNGQCTAPQLRRFIKSRPYVPMHELRRRFGIDGGDDDVTPVRLELGWVYVGLPTREGGLLGELLKAGEIGYELSLDPRTPIVIGIYPMRPIPRG
jgi:hypothetical protein